MTAEGSYVNSPRECRVEKQREECDPSWIYAYLDRYVATHSRLRPGGTSQNGSLMTVPVPEVGSVWGVTHKPSDWRFVKHCSSSGVVVFHEFGKRRVTKIRSWRAWVRRRGAVDVRSEAKELAAWKAEQQQARWLRAELDALAKNVLAKTWQRL